MPHLPFPHFTMAADEVANRYERVALDDDGLLIRAGATTRGFGVCLAKAADETQDDKPQVHPYSEGGIVYILASGSISAGDRIEPAANGRVATQSSGEAMGVALEAGTNGNKVKCYIWDEDEPVANIADAPVDAEEEHALSDTFDDEEAEAALNALGGKINDVGGKVNDILAALVTLGLMEAS